MSYTITVDYDGGQVEIEVENVDINSGRPAKLNPPGQAHPAEPPTIERIEGEIVWDELDRDLTLTEVLEVEIDQIAPQVMEEESKRRNPKYRNPPEVWAEQTN